MVRKYSAMYASWFSCQVFLLACLDLLSENKIHLFRAFLLGSSAYNHKVSSDAWKSSCWMKKLHRTPEFHFSLRANLDGIVGSSWFLDNVRTKVKGNLKCRFDQTVDLFWMWLFLLLNLLKKKKWTHLTITSLWKEILNRRDHIQVQCLSQINKILQWFLGEHGYSHNS